MPYSFISLSLSRHSLFTFPIGYPDVVIFALSCACADDGSSSWCCWTNSEKAAILLRLHDEFSHENHTRSTRGSKIIRADEARGPLRHLDKILQKHGRVIVKNYGSMFDSSAQDLTFSVTSNTIFSSSDEDLLKFLILKACFSTLWVRSYINIDGYMQKQKYELEIWPYKMHSLTTFTRQHMG